MPKRKIVVTRDAGSVAGRTEKQLMRIEQIEIKNYRSFRHAVFDGLPPMVVVVGANGTGKSTLLDVFNFLKDALTQNVAMAAAEPGGRPGHCVAIQSVGY